MKKVLSLLLCAVLCLGLCIPGVGAYNEDVTVSASLDHAELDYDAANDRTVVLTVALSKEVSLYSISLQADIPSGLILSGMESGSAAVVYEEGDNYSLATGRVSWYKGSNKTTTNLAVLTVTVPAGTAAGRYRIGVKNIELGTAGENDDNNWMEDGSAYAVLTVRSSATDSVYTVSFDANGGMGFMADVTVGEGEAYTLPACLFTAPEGKEYRAWSIDSTEYAPDAVYTVACDTVVIALWQDAAKESDELATVRFYLQGGTSAAIQDGESKTFSKEDEGWVLPSATRENYTFLGWYDSPEGGSEYTVVSGDLPPALFAQWKAKSGSGGGDGKDGGEERGINVTMRLIGAELAEKDVDLGEEEYMPDYVTWIPTVAYTLEEGSTVYDLWVKATGDAGIRSVGAEKNYVATVYSPATMGGYALSEFTNGRRSGWMYTIAGKHPGYGLREQELHDGDRVIWHYVNDYAYEVDDWFSEGQWQALGDGRYYNRWLKAPDRFGGAGGGLGEGAKAKNSGGSGDSGEVTDLIPSYDGDTVWIPAEVDHSEGGMAYAADAALTKDIVTKGLEKAEDKSKLKLWVDIQDSNRLVLQVDPDAMKEISDAGAGLRLQCSKGVIELNAETVAQLAESGRQVRMTVSYDDWNEKTKVSVGAFPPKDTDTPVTMKIELPVTKDGQALSIVNSDGSRTPIKKSAIIGDRAYAEVTGAVTLEITDIHKYWNDVKEKDWFADAVQFAVSHELMNGVDRYEFAPNAPMTRAMLVTVLYRLEDEPEITGSGDSFGDVDAKGWYAEAVAWASEIGIVNGTEKGFEPNTNITREQIATILYRYSKYIGLVVQDADASVDVSKFGDGESVSSWAQEAMAWAVEVGWFKGDDTNSLNPQGNATRAEVATLMQRIVTMIVK